MDAGIACVVDQIEDFLAWPQVRESASEEPVRANAEKIRENDLVIGLDEMTDLYGRQSLAAFSGVT